MTDSIVLIITISLIIMFSPFFAKFLKLPTTPIEIILGSILGYVGFLHDEHLFDLVAEFGFLYLMFIAGTEISLKSLLNTSSTIMKKVFIYLSFYMDLPYFFPYSFHLERCLWFSCHLSRSD